MSEQTINIANRLTWVREIWSKTVFELQAWRDERARQKLEELAKEKLARRKQEEQEVEQIELEPRDQPK